MKTKEGIGTVPATYKTLEEKKQNWLKRKKSLLHFQSALTLQY